MFGLIRVKTFYKTKNSLTQNKYFCSERDLIPSNLDIKVQANMLTTTLTSLYNSSLYAGQLFQSLEGSRTRVITSCDGHSFAEVKRR